MWLEALEGRRLLAITVSTLSDVVDGNLTPGNYSLREAIANAASGEVIRFSVDGTINLTNVNHAGELVINKNLTIQGPGADLLTIKAYDPDADGLNDGDGSRVFNVDNGNSGTFVNVTISGLTLTGGDAAGDGGAILNREHLTIQNSVITGNHAQGGDGGGGVHSRYGSLAVVDCLIQNNMAYVNASDVAIASGGAIFNRSATLQIANSKLVGNKAVVNGGAVFATGSNVTIIASTIADNHADVSGGGIRTQGQTLTVTSSTVSGNTADVDGGGIHFSNGSATITNSTVSGNSSVRNGGGVRIRTYAGNSVSIAHSTITGNRANTDSMLGDTGGGVFVTASSVTLPQLDHTIVAGNFRNVSTRDDISGSLTATFSLIGDNTGSGLAAGSPDANGNRIGSAGSPINPLLGPLADNGGPTQTHALLPGSPAIDAGDPSITFNPAEFDQRGAPFTRVFDGDGVPGARIDIGAYERLNTPLTFVVDTLVDADDGNISPGALSLREAIALANNNYGFADTITFASSLTSGGPATILLAQGELVITDSLTISGPGPEELIIDANFESRIFNITGLMADFTASGLAITNGAGGGDEGMGGGIFTYGDVTLTNSTVSGNNATGFGGGIYARGDVTLTNSLVSGNDVVFDIKGAVGGGIWAGGNVTLTNSTVSGNSVFDSDFGAAGGGIWASGNVTLTNSTVSGNGASGHVTGPISYGAASGGGIAAAGNVTLTNSTVSGNGTNSGYAGEGGGIAAAGNVMLINSSVSDNSVDGIVTAGGGIVAGGDVTLINSTISGNGLKNKQPFGSSDGGGIFTYGDVTLFYSTVTNNYALAGDATGGIYADGVTIINSIVAGNTADVNPDLRLGVSTLTVNYSLIGDTSGLNAAQLAALNSGAGNILNQNPMLGPLADNGGLTMTHALLPGSPAINAGDPGYVGPPHYDQRGFAFARAVGGRIDMGAFEAGAASADFDGDLDVDGSDFLAWQRGLGTAAPNGLHTGGDADFDRDVDAADLAVWQSQFGTTATSVAAAQSTVVAANSNAARDAVYAAVSFPLHITDLAEFRPLGKRRLRLAR